MSEKEVGRISVRVTPDTSKFARELRTKLEQIEKQLQASIEVGVDLDTAGAKAHMKTMLSELKAQAAEGVKVRVNVDSSGVARGLAKLRGGLGDNRDDNTMSRLSEAFRNLGTSAFSALSRVRLFGMGLLPVVAIASLLAPALAVVSTSLLAIPGLIAGIGIPIAAVALGLDGFKKAASGLQAPFDALKKTMSGFTEKAFTPVFDKLAVVFPLLNQELPKVTDALGQMAGGFVDVLTSQSGMDRIRGTVDNVAKSITQSIPGIQSFTEGFLTLMSKVSAKLPGLAGVFNTFAGSFKGFVDRITTAGPDGVSPLDRAMSGLKDTLQAVLDLFKQLGTQGFGGMANGGMGQTIKDFGKALQDFLRDGLPALTKVFEGLTKVLGFIPHTATDQEKQKQSQTAQDNSTKGTGQANLPGWFDPEGWGIDIKNSLGPAWESVKNSAVMAWNSIFETVSGAISSITTLVGQIPTVVSNAWAGLTAAASAAWNAVVTTVSGAVAGVLTAVTSGAGQVVSELGSWPGKFVAALGDLGSVLFEAGKNMVQGFINGVVSMADAAVDAVKSIGSNAVSSFKGLLGIHSPSQVFHDMGVNLGEGLSNGLNEGAKKAVQTAKDAAASIRDTMGQNLPSGRAAGAQASKGPASQFATDAVHIPMDFAKTTYQQFAADIGISGNGAISKIADAGLGWASKAININVGNMDEALAAHQTLMNRQALRYNR